MSIKFGVIGCGNVSQTYLYALNKNKYAEVVAVVDNNLDKAKKNANLFGIKKFYSDYKIMLKNEYLDAVVVCTPHYTHLEQVIACAERGLDILCEKPLATKMGDMLKMIKKCSHVRFSVMLQRRFYKNTASALKVIKNGLLGSINDVSLSFSCHKTRDFYSTWRGKKISGGGVLISQALHRIDLLVYFFGSVNYVYGITSKTRPYIEVEDYAKGKIFFDNNVIADIEANNSSGNPDTISIIKINGSEGRIVLSDDKALVWDVKGMKKPEEEDINNIPIKYRPAYYGPCHELLIDDFVSSIINNRDPLITGKDSLVTMKVIFGFYKSAREGKKIYIK